jgi:hypothetical protein
MRAFREQKKLLMPLRHIFRGSALREHKRRLTGSPRRTPGNRHPHKQ